MAGASLEIDDHEIIQALTRLQHAVGDLTPVLQDLGEGLLQSTAQRFRDQKDPDGKPWQELSEHYQETKPYHQDLILTLDGHLGGELRYQIGPDSLQVGTNRLYGAAHQFGRSEINLPPRPFLGASADDKADILAVIEKHLKNAI